MTYILSSGVEVKTSSFVTDTENGNEQIVFLGKDEIPMSDFCEIVHYVMTNTDLSSEKDPRIGLVEIINNYKVAPGFKKDATRTRLEYPGTDSLHYPG